MSLPPPKSRFWSSFVMRDGRSKKWPARFGVRIPMRIKMKVTVRPDFAWILPPEQRDMILNKGEIYVATTNSHGAVAGVCACGNELGVKPEEFEIVEWHIVGVHVDESVEYPAEMCSGVPRNLGQRWSHLWCDPGHEEALHVVAQKIGMKLRWFQNKPGFPHYDLVPAKFELAKKEGVQVTCLRAWVKARRPA